MVEAQAKQALKNGKDLKQVLTALKENRDQIEKSTGRRPDIDDTTKPVSYTHLTLPTIYSV